MKHRIMFEELYHRLKEPRRFIQVLLGPRQVGKTTLALQVASALDKPSYYISADAAMLQNAAWIHQQWEVGRSKIRSPSEGALLIIDEVQKIPNWSEVIKLLWDRDTRENINLSLVILGSSPWLMQKGLTESLAGRFENIAVPHWSYREMREIFHWDIDTYLYFGGYPGAAPLADRNDVTRWKNYINESLIETTIARDILLMTQVNKPALLRRLFQLGCVYCGQILSYSKMIEDLQEVGNTTTLAHYLTLLSGAGLLEGLQKFTSQAVRQRGASPKFAVYNTALMSSQCGKTFKEAKEDPMFWGRLVESAVGAHLLNAIRGSDIELFYWREKDKEVDFVLRQGKRLISIGVKSSPHNFDKTGVDLFMEKFKPHRNLLVGPSGIPLETFFLTPLSSYFS